MGHHPTGLTATCDIKDCGQTKTWDNPLGLCLHNLFQKAEADDWFLPIGGGSVLCPLHQKLAAAKYKLSSLYTNRPRATLPINGKKQPPTMEEK